MVTLLYVLSWLLILGTTAEQYSEELATEATQLPAPEMSEPTDDEIDSALPETDRSIVPRTEASIFGAEKSIGLKTEDALLEAERSIVPEAEAPVLELVEPPSGEHVPEMSRTIIFLEKVTRIGQHVFIRGGLSHANNNECAVGPYEQSTDVCAIIIKHSTSSPASSYEYPFWSEGDNYLDFEGAEMEQGSFNGRRAFGTPTVWTTNNPEEKRYHPYNKYGQHYWMVELLMDCSKTDNGWFEFKGFMTPAIGWEADIKQDKCSGDGGVAPFKSKYHIAKCGAVNVFYWGSSQCHIEKLPPPILPPEPEPTEVTAPETLQRTMIFLKKDTLTGQYLFIRGGISHANKNACPAGPYQQKQDKCAIPIRHNTTAPATCKEYPAWSEGDDYLDFEGPEIGQGLFLGKKAAGTPTVWTTNNHNENGFHPYNKYGKSYWLVELLMDCRKIDDGWFELKGFIAPRSGLELTIYQRKCTGNGGSAPFTSNYHIAKCGAINVFEWGSSRCHIEMIPHAMPSQLPPTAKHPVSTKEPTITKRSEPRSPQPHNTGRTLIFLRRDTIVGQYVFLRGGLSHANNNECPIGPYEQKNDKCAIPIIHNTSAPLTDWEYPIWSEGDNYLDFEGPEITQGACDGVEASGTPTAWTTSNKWERGYHSLNKYGRSYWLVALLMDCTKTDNGWFEIKGFMTPAPGYEPDIQQGKCSGDAGPTPFKSTYHVARCGATNVFQWGSSRCHIEMPKVPTVPPPTVKSVETAPVETNKPIVTETEAPVPETESLITPEKEFPV